MTKYNDLKAIVNILDEVIAERDDMSNALLPSDRYRIIGYKLRSHLETIKETVRHKMCEVGTMTDKFGCADPECFGCDKCEIG